MGLLFDGSIRRWVALLSPLALAMFIAVCAPSDASAAECTDTWTGPSTGNWGTASSWSAGHVPGASDVACAGPSTLVFITSGANTAAVVQAEGRFWIEGGSLELTSTSVASSVKNLLITNSTLKGPGRLDVTTEMRVLASGVFAGPGKAVVDSGATAELSGSGMSIAGGTLVNLGTATFSGEMSVSEGGLLENNGVFIANSTSESHGASIYAGAGAAPSFVNTGTLDKTRAFAPQLGTWIGIPFVNSGTVQRHQGYLGFKGGGSSVGGTWKTGVFSAGSFSFSGDTFEGQEEFTGATVTAEGVFGPSAEIAVRAGSLTVPSGHSISISKLRLVEATLGGAGTVNVSGELFWMNAGVMSGSGQTTLEPGSKATLEGVGMSLNERRLVNEGTVTFSGGDLKMAEGARLENTGKFFANSESEAHGAAIYSGSGSSPTYINKGTTEKTKGYSSYVTKIAVPFLQAGIIGKGVGTLTIQNPLSILYSSAIQGKACAGDPVDCATGSFTETQTDFAIGGRGVGLDLIRTYSAKAAAAGTLGIFGYGWTNSFGDHLTSEEGGATETLTEASGGTVTFTKSGAAWIAPSWSRDALTGSTESGFTLTLPDRTKEKFNGSGRLESVTDRNGNETTLAYNGSGKLETITDPSGRTITLTYNGEGLVEKAKDPMGHEAKYAYESKNLQSVTLPGAASPSWQFKYDASHRMTSFTDGRGGKTTNEYDSSSRVISQTDPAERNTTLEFAPFHTKITNKATGAVTDEWFNSNNQPYSITRGFGTASASTETFTYTAAGLLASRTDGNGHATTYGYDAEGNRTSERDAEGDETKWTFDGAHQVVSATTPKGEKTTITRNAAGNPETVSRPAPGAETQTVSYEYGPHGEVKTMTDPLGHVWSYEYDKYGDRTAETDPEGDRRTWAYDEDSRLISMVSPRGNEEGAEAAKFTTSIERDVQGRPIKVTDPLGGITKYAYDTDGNVESTTDPNGRKTKFTYDADNELTKVERPNGATEETGYDGAGRVTSQTDGNKRKTTYVRNVLEQPIETIDPLERKTVQTFDAAGNLRTKKDPEGRTTTYGYDSADRLKEVSYSDGVTPKATFAYDKDGDVTGMTDGTGESTYEYDQLDRLTHRKNSHGETVSWEYNLGDEAIGLTYPNGKSISRAYDKAGRLESVTDWLGHTTSFAYNKDSAPTLTTFPSATTDTDEYGYDRADRMASVTMKKGAETLASISCSRDPAGQLESLISKGLPGAESESFGYDENERLTKAGSAEFGYDAANNLTKAPGTTNAYDKASQIESATGATYTYNKEGGRTKRTPSSGPATTYKYDQGGDLTAVERTEEGETPAIAESFAYDGSGLLASRTVGLTTTHLVWDLSESPELLLSDGSASYVYGPGGSPIEQISSEEVPTYLHHDQVGSTRLLTNSSGETKGTFTYGAYGALTGHTGTATTVFGYAGQYTLGQSGLIYVRARYYDSATAQFLTLDPEAPSTRAPYFYANDNPANLRDRSGRAAEATEGGCPIPVCYPFPTSAEAERAGEALGELGEEIGEEIGSGVSSLWSSMFGDESSTEEAEVDGPKAEEVSCPEETKTVIGDRSQEMTKAGNFLKQIDIAKGSNPQQPTGGPRWTRIAALLAELWRHLPR